MDVKKVTKTKVLLWISVGVFYLFAVAIYMGISDERALAGMKTVNNGLLRLFPAYFSYKLAILLKPARNIIARGRYEYFILGYLIPIIAAIVLEKVYRINLKDKLD